MQVTKKLIYFIIRPLWDRQTMKGEDGWHSGIKKKRNLIDVSFIFNDASYWIPGRGNRAHPSLWEVSTYKHCNPKERILLWLVCTACVIIINTAKPPNQCPSIKITAMFIFFTDYKSSLTCLLPSCTFSTFGASHLKYTFTGSIFQCLWNDTGTWWER